MSDVVTIGSATLYCGDCREILPTLGRFDACITDPPYGIFAHGGKWGKKSELQWDKKPADNLAQIFDYSEAQAIWGGNYFLLLPSRGWLVWHKRDSVPSAADVELCWTSLDMNARLIDQTIAATNAERAGHPTQKPLAVMRFTLSFFPNAKTILDPFMGSGTTGVAAIQLGRTFTGIERERKYFDIACERISRAQAQGQLIPHEMPKQVQESLV